MIINRFALSATLLLLAFSSQAQVYDIVVAKDGTGNYTTIQAAINASTGTNRTIIFVKKGVYNEKLYLGSHSTSISKVISLIGENRDSVVLSWNDYNGKMIYYYNSTTLAASGTPQSATMTVNAADFYMENMTVQNTYTSAQAVALYTLGDRQTFKNCRIVGFQDTQDLKKGRRTFFYQCQIEGGTDFIFAGGTAYFYQCTIKSLSGGQYITAPEDLTYSATLSTGKTLYYGFIFKDCDLVSGAGLSANSVYLGRPWKDNSGSVFLNCRLGGHIRSLGWSIWNADTPQNLYCSFAEYQSMNTAGTALADVSGRVNWSIQLTTADVNNFLKLNTIYAALGSSTAFDPIAQVIAPTPVAALSINGQTLQWSEISGAKGYVVYANGSALGFTTTGSFTDTTTRTSIPVYTVRTVGVLGNLSLTDGSTDLVTAASIHAVVNGNVSAVHNPSASITFPWIQTGMLFFKTTTDFTLYTTEGKTLMQGKQLTNCNLSELPKGVYLLKANDTENGHYTTKIQL
jgi:pectinesterase